MKRGRMAGWFAGLYFAGACSGWAAEPEADREPDSGVEFSLLYRADISSNLSGGLRQGTTVLGNLDAKIEADFEPLLGWSGTSGLVHVIASNGGKPNEHFVGSLQGVNNIEVETNTTKIFQAWIQKQWWDARASALFGLYDLNSEFYVSHSTWIFLHPSPGIGSEFSQTGRNGPSIFPTSSLALRLKYHPTEETYVQAAVLDAVPGDPEDPRGTHIRFDNGDGTLRVAEMGYIPKKIPGDRASQLPPTDKYAFGYWSYTAPFEDLLEVDGAGSPLMRRGDSGYYLLAEKILYFGQRPGSHVDGFLRYGRANADVHPISNYFQTGIVFTKMVRGRDDDQFAVSYSRAHIADKYRAAVAQGGEQATHYEAVWEMTYRAPMNAWLTLQPDLQYVIHPGADARLRNATVLGLRFEFALEH